MATSAAPSAVSAVEQSAAEHHHAEHKRKRQQKIALPETASIFAQPLLPYVMGSTIQQYFTELKDVVDISEFARVEKADVEEDGLYLHKRPVHGMKSANAGTVTHHVVLYLKEGDKLHSIDFGPDNGADVTSNFLADHPAREVLRMDTRVPDEDILPLMYIGKPDVTLTDDTVAQAVSFAETQLYHALRNNCIHFADMMVRVLTRGRVRGAPLVYDLVCGEVPAQDPPESLVLVMLGLSWFALCDGSPLTARFLSSLDQPSLQHSLSISDLPSKRQEAEELADKDTNPPSSSYPSATAFSNPSAGAAILSVLSTLQNTQKPESIPVRNNAGPNLMTLLNFGADASQPAVGLGPRPHANSSAHHTLVESTSTDSLQSTDTRDEA